MESNFLEKGAIKRAKRRLAPLMRSDEVIEDFDVSTLDGDGRRMDLIATGRALYLIDVQAKRDIRLAYETINSIFWQPDNAFYSGRLGIHFFDGQGMWLSVKHPRGLCDLLKDHVESQLLDERHIERDGRAGIFSFRPIEEGGPPIWLVSPDKGVEVDDEWKQWTKNVTDSLIAETGIGQFSDKEDSNSETAKPRSAALVEARHTELASLQASPAITLSELERRNEILVEMHDLGEKVDAEFICTYYEEHFSQMFPPIGRDALWQQDEWDKQQEAAVKQGFDLDDHGPETIPSEEPSVEVEVERRAETEAPPPEVQPIEAVAVEPVEAEVEVEVPTSPAHRQVYGQGLEEAYDKAEFVARQALLDHDPETALAATQRMSEIERQLEESEGAPEEPTSTQDEGEEDSNVQGLRDAYDEAEFAARQALLDHDPETALAATQRMSEIELQLEELEDAPENSTSIQDEVEEDSNEFDAMPLLETNRPEEASHLTVEQTTTVDEPARLHDHRWCSVRKANILPGPDGVCPACGTKINA